MPFDLVHTSPPFSKALLHKRVSGEYCRGWLNKVASLMESLRPTYVFVESGSLLFAFPRRLPAIVARLTAQCDRDEPYAEGFVFGSPADYAVVVHETAAGAITFDLSEAFTALRVADLAKHVRDRGGVRYRCFEKKAAFKLALLSIKALAEAGALTLDWALPLKPISINRGDGGQDGLFHLARRSNWLQVTGGEKPSILPHAKWPGPAAAHFFHAEGTSSSALKSKSPLRRRMIYGKNTPERADIIHIVVGKAAPLPAVASAIRGIASESVSRDGRAPMLLRTVSLHPIEVFDPLAGNGTFDGI